MAACAVALGVLVARRGAHPGRGAVLVGCGGLVLWCLSSSAQLWSTNPDLKQKLGGGLYLGISLAVLGLARAIIDLAGRPRLRRWAWALIAIPVVITPVLVATGWRSLVLADLVVPAARGPMQSSSGPWFFVFSMWGYGLLVSSLVVFGTVAQSAPPPLRRQAQLVALIVGTPMLVNLAFISGLISTGSYDPTPYAVLVSLAGLAWGMTRARLMDSQIGVVTVARDQVVEAMRDPVLTIDHENRILDLNPAAMALVHASEPPLGSTVTDLFPGWPRLRPGAAAATAEGSFEHDGRTFDVAVTGVDEPADGRIRVAVLRDSTRRELSERSTREWADVSHHRATHDYLTGLSNRSALFAALGTHFVERDGQPAALMVLDLDGFKALNDSFGHRAGDDVLRELSHRLSAIVDDEVLVARVGGDEFALWFPSIGADEAHSIAQRVVDSVRVPFAVGDADVRLGGSLGIALVPAHGDDPDTLMYAADVAMYEAKRDGRGVSVFALNEGQRHPGRLRLTGELRRALENGEIDVHYQPQRNVGGELVGLEALARWNHPERGILGPAQFLPLAEESGLICEITDQVLQRALADAKAWGARGESARLSVNLSGQDLRDPRLPRRVSDALARHGVEPHALTLEVTENALITARDTTRHLDTLRESGIRLALDDFGTGFAPLATLRQLSVDEIKIDRIFVSGMGTRDAVLVNALLKFGHDLGLVVVAEGVETADERDALIRLECDLLQGYFLGRPLPIAHVDFGPLTGITPNGSRPEQHRQAS